MTTTTPQFDLGPQRYEAGIRGSAEHDVLVAGELVGIVVRDPRMNTWFYVTRGGVRSAVNWAGRYPAASMLVKDSAR